MATRKQHPKPLDADVKRFLENDWAFVHDQRLSLKKRIDVLRSIERHGFHLDITVNELAAVRFWLKELRLFNPSLFEAFESRGFALQSRGGGMYAFEKPMGKGSRRLVVVEQWTPMAPLKPHTIVDYGIEESDRYGLTLSVWSRSKLTAKSFLDLYDKLKGHIVPDATWESEDV